MSRPREGWVCVSPRKGKCWIAYRHRSGWVVRHCGHMTAIWPYYAIDPTDPERATVTHNGKGWRTLLLAQEAIERVIAGRAIATIDRCGPATRRVVEQGEV